MTPNLNVPSWREQLPQKLHEDEETDEEVDGQADEVDAVQDEGSTPTIRI